ncbi:hypothetical protein, conserved [Trypanosoma brucei gambiense DAL972]|uniref:FCP1 homology domain-containing protein n=1 Tax=Trypanosoma brucei gambiense (strain MHOM/CI/86/DAL972) TaxID=679716 RepID=D0A4U1_TRYB9|nr:hypothetical protein, conserved [Trypanosoma brucei gambiense DAL972]CBH16285.1 hypothetical protein, conserved [Trypanosoma brucei gambiense DAL972]|eukprot:XP_011778549.1 hypothetical protein, conserved [Trypanosoma brucei gambiense DAL972]
MNIFSFGRESMCSFSATEGKESVPLTARSYERSRSELFEGLTTTRAVALQATTSSNFPSSSNAKQVPDGEGLFSMGSCSVSTDKVEENSTICETSRSAGGKQRKQKGQQKPRKAKANNSRDDNKKKNATNTKTPQRTSRKKSGKRKKRRSSCRSMGEASVRSNGTPAEGEIESSNAESSVQLPRPFNTPKGVPAVVHVVAHNIAEMQGRKRESCVQSLSRPFEMFDRIVSRPECGKDAQETPSTAASHSDLHTSISVLKGESSTTIDLPERSNSVVGVFATATTPALPSSPPLYGRSSRREHTARAGDGTAYLSSLTFSSLLGSFQKEQEKTERPPAKSPSTLEGLTRHSLTDMVEGKVPSKTEPVVERLLARTLSSTSEKERTATIVFDLDETLCNNRVNGPAILRPGAIDILGKLRSLYPRCIAPGDGGSPVRDASASAESVGNSGSRSGLVPTDVTAGNGPLVQLEIVLWTASVESVARPVVDRLDPDGTIFDCVICRDARWYDESGYTKDLRLLGRYIERSVIVENSPLCVKLNRRNAILVSDFVRNRMDRQLYVVCVILLEWLDNVNNLLLRKHMMRVNMERRRGCGMSDGGESPEPEMPPSEAQLRGSKTPGLTKPHKADMLGSTLPLHELERRASAIYFVGSHPFISPSTRLVRSSACQQAVRYLCGEGFASGKMKIISRRRPAAKHAAVTPNTPKGRSSSLTSISPASVPGRAPSREVSCS